MQARMEAAERNRRLGRSVYRAAAPAYFFHTAGSASILMKRPPTTDRAWKPCCLAVVVSYQSVSGTRLADSAAKRYEGATIASKSAWLSASVAVHRIQSSFV